MVSRRVFCNDTFKNLDFLFQVLGLLLSLGANTFVNVCSNRLSIGNIDVIDIRCSGGGSCSSTGERDEMFHSHQVVPCSCLLEVGVPAVDSRIGELE